MPAQLDRVDRMFHALADPTRRRIVERLAAGPVATSELARPFAMSLPSVTQHLGVLEGAELVISRKRGRVRTYGLAPDALVPLNGWLSDQQLLWERRLDRMDALVLDLKENS